ncbi:cell division regulator GpsB [Streptococcus chenjunshii]|uniref:Cell cycle protein GpsB n=1 Tax=Streptococcus chenjunshii TaxID=2173853 RepID=A0A372KJE1_9STRE|nr:cell division regulator GpsB [Streptococcus chenjunshii]AXQ79238.1 cell division regulator GpsB [Streptococcus chenjunshii]RFU50183.1 cell division regulator GpsB [Streptococcus chenjunshii]RFU52370.1 cell division regulator GpsB [Streptococcus chenjunshii]
MASIIFSPKDIFEQEFRTSMRGYDRKEVDEFLDDVIKDYETYIAQIQELREENEKLKQAAARAKTANPAPAQAAAKVSAPVPEQTRVAQSATNFDILKRISRLEKEVFGKQIVE